MLNSIITEHQLVGSYPAPACNLSGKDVEPFVEGLADYVASALFPERALAVGTFPPRDRGRCRPDSPVTASRA